MKRLLIIILLLITACTQPQVCINNKCFDVDLAITQDQKQQGLMYRPYLKNNQGMLFVYNESGIHSFWMKNTLIPLDIIWIEDNTIVHIALAQPCKKQCPTINSNTKATHVLEVAPGNNFKVGDSVEIRI